MLAINELDSLANSPDVRPFIGRAGQADFLPGAAFYGMNNAVLGDKDVCGVAEYLAPGAYNVHIMAAKHCRGKTALSRAKAMLRQLTSERGAVEFWAIVPRSNRPSRSFVRALGFSAVDTHWLREDGTVCVRYVIRGRFEQ